MNAAQRLASQELAAATLIDPDSLKNFCKRSVENFIKEYEEHVVTHGNRRYIYINNGAPVLWVAHMDTVINPQKKFNFNVYSRDGITICKTPTLDDRLGMYLILDLLPSLLGEGCADILITDEEESGRSTADLFARDWADEKVIMNRNINWIAEFDRAGSWASGSNDVVLYDFDDGETRTLLKKHGFKNPGRGLFTDICRLHDLKVKAFNFGVGYHDNHSTTAWACFEELERIIGLYVAMHKKIKDTKLEHERKYTTTTAHWQPKTYLSNDVFFIGEMVSLSAAPTKTYMVVSYSGENYTIDDDGDTITISGRLLFRKTGMCALCK